MAAREAKNRHTGSRRWDAAPGEGRSAGRQLTFYFSVLVVLLALTAVARAVVTEYATRQMTEVANRWAPAGVTNAKVLQSLTDVQAGIRGYQLTGDAAFMDTYSSGTAGFLAAVDSLRDLRASDPDLGTLLDRQETLGKRWWQTYAEPVSEGERVDAEEAASAFAAIPAANADAQARIDTNMVASMSAAKDLIRLVNAVSALITLITVTVTLYLAYRAVGDIIRPLRALSITLRRLERGDSHERAPVFGPAEVQNAANGVNKLAVENQRLRMRQEHEGHMREVARTIGVAVRAHLDVDTVLQELVDKLGPVIGADRVYVQLSGLAGGMRLKQWHAPGLVPLPPSLLTQAPGRIDAAMSEQDPEAPPGIHFRQGRILMEIGGGDGANGTVTMAFPREYEVPDGELGLLALVREDIDRALHHSSVYAEQNRLLAEVKALDEHKERFLADVTREIRNPLSSIQGYLELIDESPAELPAPAQKMIAVIDRNAHRLRALVDDMVTLSSIRPRLARAKGRPVALADVVNAVAGEYRSRFESQEVTFTVDCRAEAAEIGGDADLLAHALRNLLDNAAKFTSKSGTATLRCTIPPRMVGDAGTSVLTVSDTGIGIPPAEVDRVFGEFYRASNAVRAAVEGPGLGLSLVKEIIEAHSGRIKITSELSRGTQVTAELPLLKAAPTTA
ncbi:signal transduction histidine kinase [Catenuloplanes nepalensis]|uniref:Sensor-like histidine kinase SenX3 n=1 Tax=Catenuloplanes nepalensis TaxID=587533 RepID=A0ABT9ML75_9ACTN|nr:ATP-binding protein [Catenuloplanes nepalensis]MDP9792174.1 signal transduction histidine kinase [Catenuloplanes nepalensis]